MKWFILIIPLLLMFVIPVVNAIEPEITIGDNTILENQQFINKEYDIYLDGGNVGIRIKGNNSIIRNCTIMGYFVNIQIYGNNNIIENCRMLSGCDGVQINNESYNTIVRNNYFLDNKWGMCIWQQSDRTIIYNNTFFECDNAALDMRYTSNISVFDNNFYRCRFEYCFELEFERENIEIGENYYDDGKGDIIDFDESWAINKGEIFHILWKMKHSYFYLVPYFIIVLIILSISIFIIYYKRRKN